MIQITCPKCSCDFDGESWEEGACPKCGAKYWIDTFKMPYTGDWEDGYDEVPYARFDET